MVNNNLYFKMKSFTFVFTLILQKLNNFAYTTFIKAFIYLVINYLNT